ncbi:MAG: tetratricopeptide repeat protein [Candidatus Krumholzibacteria bacterium]|nr:tetratricopeptide repeat protein [Candidatus Krumholzibacteria bacterium]
MGQVLEQKCDGTMESQTLYDLALRKINANKFREALNHLIEALRIAPSNPVYLSYFGLCLAHVERDYSRAIRVSKQALRVFSKDPMLHVNLGKIYKLKGSNALAHRQFLRAWELNKRHPVTAVELTRMGIRRPPFIRFLSRRHWANRCLGVVRATLERRLVGHRQC